MKLERSNQFLQQYRCELTRELDELSGLDQNCYYWLSYHYIVPWKEHWWKIRIPAGEVGRIFTDSENTIQKVYINQCNICSYPYNVIKKLEKYIGEIIEN